MAITLTTAPQYPLPGSVEVTATASSGNFVRLWITDAPPGSKWKTKIAESSASRLPLATLGSGDFFKLDADKAGGYVLTAQEYTRGASTYGGGYQGDPNADTTETKVGSEVSLTVYVGQRLEHRLGCSLRGYATLVLYVFGATVRATTKAIHGEVSPAIVKATTPKALAASHDATVVAAIADIIDETASAIVADVATLIAELKTDIPLHMNNSAAQYHVIGTADTDNDTDIERLPSDAATPEGIALAARVLRQRLQLHLELNADGLGNWHTVPDFTNTPIANVASNAADMTSALAAIADCVRAYEAHRVDTTVHNLADTDNAISTTLAPLLALHKAFIAAMQPVAPTAPANLNPGSVTLGAFGFIPSER